MSALHKHILLLVVLSSLLALGVTASGHASGLHSDGHIFLLTLSALLLLGAFYLRRSWLHAQAGHSLLQALQHAGLPLLLLNPQREVLFANPAFLELDHANENLADLYAFGSNWRDAIERHIAQALGEEQRSQPEEILLKPGDQREAMLLRLGASQVLDAEGRACLLISAENLSAHNQTLSAAIEREHTLRTRTQRYVQTLIDVIPQPVYVKDEAGRFVLVNQTFCARHNLTRQDLIGQARQVLDADILRAEEALQEDLRVMAGTPIFREEHLRPEGRDLYFVISKQSCEDPEGRRVLVGTQMDITPWRTAEQAVKDALLRETVRRERTQAFVQRLLDVFPNPVCLKDTQSRYVMVNEAFVTSRGKTREELLKLDSMDVANMLVNDDPEHLRVARQRAHISNKEDRAVLAGTPLIKEENGILDHNGVLHDRIVTKNLCEDPEGQQLIVMSMFDITDMRNAQRELSKALEAEQALRERSVTFVQRLIDVIPHPVYVKNPAGQALLVNEAFVADCGRPREELLGKTHAEMSMAAAAGQTELLEEIKVRGPESSEEDLAVLAGTPLLKEVSNIHAFTGRHLDRIVSKAACADPNGDQVIVVAMFDVTELRSAQREQSRALEAEKDRRTRTEAFIQRLIDVIPSPVFVRDTEGWFKFINEAFVKDRGRTRETILSRQAWGVAPGSEVEARVRAEDTRVIAGEIVYKEEVSPHFDTGQDRYRIISKRACEDPDGKIVIVGTNFDITSWRLAERELQATLARETSRRERTQAFVQRLLDVLPYPVSIKNTQSQYLIVNEAFAQSRGCSKEEIVSKTPIQVLNLIAPDDSDYRKVASEHAQISIEEDRAVLGGARIRKETSRVMGHTGKQRDLIVTKGACEDPEGEPVIVVSLFDITELRETQRELHTAFEAEKERSARIQAFVQRLLDVIPEPVYVKDASTRYVMVNEAFAAQRQQAKSDIVGKSARELAPNQAIADQVMAEDAEVLAGKTLRKIDETPHPLTGQARWRIISKGSCLDPEGAPVIVGANIDITSVREVEQKLASTLAAEKDLRQRTQIYIQSLLDAIPLPICVRDQDSRHIQVNARFLSESSLQPAQIIGQRIADFITDPAQIEASLAEDQEVLAGREIFIEKQDVGLNAHELRDLIISKRRCLDVDQRTVIVVAHIDVTDQREAERQALALMANEKSLRQRTQAFIQRIIDAIPHSFYIKDQASRYILINQAFQEELKLPAEAILGHSTLEISPDPDKAQAVMQEDQRVLAGKELTEERHETSISGGTEWADRIVSKLRCLDVDGKPVIAASHLDITAHRNIERALQAALAREAANSGRMQEFLQHVIDVLPQEFYIKDADSRLLMANPVYLKRRGMTRVEEALGKSSIEIGDHYLLQLPEYRDKPAALEAARQDLQENWQIARDEDLEILQGKTVLKRVIRQLPGPDAQHVMIIAKAACLDPQGAQVIVCASYDLAYLDEQTLLSPAENPSVQGA